MAERLTRHSCDGTILIKKVGVKYNIAEISKLQNAAIEKLTSYEDAEEQGRLVVLPCKVGADIYALICGEIKVCVCVGWKWNRGNIYTLCMDRESGQERSFFDFHFTGKIGGLKTVFLTRQEAEKALGAQSEEV